MHFRVSVTDGNWFNFLSHRLLDEVNFWQPGGKLSFRAIEPGEPFLFKLHSPLNYIVGGGFFVRHSFLPIYLAWEAFREKNGVPSFEGLIEAIRKHRGINSHVQHDANIGCIILTSPFFFERDQWIPVPEDWSPSIQQGKTYDTAEPLGAMLWHKVEQQLRSGRETMLNLQGASLAAEEIRKYGSAYVAYNRLGQSAFRIVVMEAYNRRCAITGERTLPALEAAHIKPYSKTGPHLIVNGLFMRSDLHRLFDQGYLSVTNDLHVEISRRIKEKYENGREYYKMHGKTCEVIPANPNLRPSPKYLEWHNENVFLG